MDTNWIIRSAQPDDIAFIYSSWLKSFRHDSALGKSMRSSVFYETYREILDHILISADIHIACLPYDTSVILGYLIAQQPNIIHYSFVKEAFRRMGILNSLLGHSLSSASNCIYTHKTQSISQFIIGRSQYTYNPLILYKK